MKERRRITPLLIVVERVSTWGRPYRSQIWHKKSLDSQQPVRAITTTRGNGLINSSVPPHKPPLRRSHPLSSSPLAQGYYKQPSSYIDIYDSYTLGKF